MTIRMCQNRIGRMYLAVYMLAALITVSLVLPVTLFAQDQHYYDSLHAAYAFATQDTDRSDILLKLATALEDVDTATAMSYATQSYDFAEKAGDNRRVASVELFEAHQFSNTGLYDSARAKLLHTVTMAEK